MAQCRSYLQSRGPNVGNMCILGSLGKVFINPTNAEQLHDERSTSRNWMHVRMEVPRNCNPTKPVLTPRFHHSKSSNAIPMRNLHVYGTFPKLGVPFWGVLIIRIAIYWGLYWGPPI